MVSNGRQEQVFPDTQITFSWFSRFESSISFAEFTFRVFNWTHYLTGVQLLDCAFCEQFASKERQPKCITLAMTCHHTSSARVKVAECTTKKYHDSILLVSSNNFESCLLRNGQSLYQEWEEETRRFEIWSLTPRRLYFFLLFTNRPKISVNWTQQWLLLK